MCTYKKKKQETFLILVDGADFYIIESLYGAPRQMRLWHTTRVLWANVICINQAEDAEKSAQVAMVAHIYCMGRRDPGMDRQSGPPHAHSIGVPA